MNIPLFCARPILPWRELLLTGILVLTVVFSYAPSLGNGFVNWDDDAHLLENPFIESLSQDGLAEIFTTTVNKIYIPLTTLTFAVEYHFFGADPLIYHWHNLVLHILVTLGVLLLGARCGLSLAGSFAAALIFGIHPIHVESVAWVTERKDVLSAFLYIAALVVYAGYVRRRGAAGGAEGGVDSGRLLVVFILGVASALAKPMALSLPLVLLVLDWFLRRRWSFVAFLEKILLAGLMAPVIWMTYVQHLRVVELRWPESVLLWLWSFSFYLKKFFYPDFFVVFYPAPRPLSIMQGECLTALTVVIISFLAAWVFRRKRWLVLSVLFYFASIFFLLRLDQSADANIVADRFMYLPSIGFCFLLGAGWDRVWGKAGSGWLKRAVVVIMALLVVASLGQKTFRQNLVWRDGVSLWENQLRYRPQAATALVLVKLGDARALEPGFQKYVQDVRACRQIRGEDERCLAAEGDESKMETVAALYDLALSIKPADEGAWFGLARLYAGMGEWDAALDYFSRILNNNPKHFDAYYEQGRIYQAQGRFEDALAVFQKAVTVSAGNRRLCRKILNICPGVLCPQDEGKTAGDRVDPAN